MSSHTRCYGHVRGHYLRQRSPPPLPSIHLNRGNVRVVEIDGPVVRLELEGACGSCPSSTMTMKMGLERRLVQRIPEISEVIQSIPNGPDLNVSWRERGWGAIDARSSNAAISP